MYAFKQNCHCNYPFYVMATKEIPLYVNVTKLWFSHYANISTSHNVVWLQLSGLEK